jgi:hypothetical protein
MELTNEEKQNIINQHIRNVNVNVYNLQITLMAEEAVQSPNQETVSSLNAKIQEELRKNAALLSELESLQA